MTAAELVQIKPAQVTVDSVDPFALADWWRERLGWQEIHRTTHRAHVIIEAQDGSGWQMCFVQVPDPTPGKNRLHLDFHCADRRPRGPTRRSLAWAA